jgi:hypothetical protein
LTFGQNKNSRATTGRPYRRDSIEFWGIDLAGFQLFFIAIVLIAFI